MTRETIFQELKETLKQSDLTLAWAARRVGITAGYLIMMSKGRGNPSTDLLQRLIQLTAKLQEAEIGKAV